MEFSFAIACRLYSEYIEEKLVDTMDYEEQYYEYDLVPTHDFDDYWMDDNKFNALPWEDKRFDFFSPSFGILRPASLGT